MHESVSITQSPLRQLASASASRSKYVVSPASTSGAESASAGADGSRRRPSWDVSFRVSHWISIGASRSSMQQCASLLLVVSSTLAWAAPAAALLALRSTSPARRFSLTVYRWTCRRVAHRRRAAFARRLGASAFNGVDGYGYGDVGRELDGVVRGSWALAPSNSTLQAGRLPISSCTCARRCHARSQRAELRHARGGYWAARQREHGRDNAWEPA